LDRGTNERRGGREVIATLAEGLPPLGIVVCEPVEEDWGWCLFATTNGVRPMVGCGPYEEYDDGWLVFVEPPRGLRAWFKRDSITAATTKIAAAMRDVIAGDGRFHHLRWWTDPAGLGPTEPADGHDR
jgi:hypothetical protein